MNAQELRHVTTKRSNRLDVKLSEEKVSDLTPSSDAGKSNPFNSKQVAINKWGRYSNWKCNGPQLEHYGVAAFTGFYKGRQKSYLLLFGGVFNLQSGGVSIRNETWTYSPDINSWRLLDDLDKHPTRLEMPLLVTICSQNVIMINSIKWPYMKSGWLFLGSVFKWKKVTVRGQMSTWFQNRLVSIKDNNSSCSCQEAIFHFPCSYSNVDISLVDKLVCIEEANIYSWRQIKIKTSASVVTNTCMPVVTSSSKETVFTVIENCLWHFSVYNLTWVSTTICTQQKDSFRVTEFFFAAAVFMETTMSYVLFSSSDKRVLIFNLLSGTAASESVVGNVPLSGYSYLSRPPRAIDIAVSIDRSILVYTPGRTNYCGLRKWILENPANSSVWVWKQVITTDKSRAPPPAGFAFDINYAIYNNKLYVLQNLDDYHMPYLSSNENTDHIWSLDLLSMRWEVLVKSDEKISDYTNKLANTWFYENLWCVSDDVMNLWQYNTNITYSWSKMIAHNSPRPVRTSYSFVAANHTHLIVFGGRTNQKSTIFNDLWLFSSREQNWKNLESSNTPSPRYDHASVVADSVMYVYGGSNNTSIHKPQTCFEELWKYHISTNKWMLVDAVNSSPNLTVIKSCKAYAASSKGQIWISVGCINDMNECRPEYPYIQIWTYIIHLNMWQRVGIYQWGVDIAAWSLEREVLPILFWNEHLIMLGKSELALFYMKVGCPAGFASVDISKQACNICDVGLYAEEGATTCRPCPGNTTTKSRGSIGISECFKCQESYCHYGRCYVTTFNSTPASNCQCDIGYTGSRCQYPTYYYVGFGIALVLLVTVTGMMAIVYIWRKRKKSERALRREIEKLNGVWQISKDEIELLEEIGKGASGSVWLARYRDITVAIKMTLAPDDVKMCLDFTREINFMQTMRHRNIVLFLGAGKAGVNAQPFLVVEYMSKGTLRQVLDDTEIELTSTRKIQFASDVAHGMRFLHNLDPPRIHRDLKSENLLVSESWIVKVADFGLGRFACFHEQNRRSRVKRSRSNIHDDDKRRPLLSASNEMSLDGIGTARWCAPELSRRQKYDGSVDVYRLVYLKTIFF